MLTLESLLGQRIAHQERTATSPFHGSTVPALVAASKRDGVLVAWILVEVQLLGCDWQATELTRKRLCPRPSGPDRTGNVNPSAKSHPDNR